MTKYTASTNVKVVNFKSSQNLRTKAPENLSTNEATETFQWTQQWYPVAATEILDPFRPHPMQLLGKSPVIWRDAQQQWHCFEDACPHRLVPLSEGRVRGGMAPCCVPTTLSGSMEREIVLAFLSLKM